MARLGAPRCSSRRQAQARPVADRRHAYADALVDKIGDANREVIDAMCQISGTIDGLAFKARISLEHEDNLYVEPVTSIMDDILTMGGAHA